VKRLLRRLRREDGQGLITGLLLLAGVLLPLIFLVPLFARIEQGRLAAAQTAREAVRAAVQAPDAAAAQAAADRALARAREQTDQRLSLRLSGEFTRGGVLHAQARSDVSVASLPFFGRFGTIAVTGEASAPVDRYRSLLGSSP
jgi:hypothetical protein